MSDISKLKIVGFLVLAIILLASCSDSNADAKHAVTDKEIVEVEQILDQVEESKETIDKMDAEFEFDEDIELPISIRNFLYNYYTLADKELENFVSFNTKTGIATYISVHLEDGEYDDPKINIRFNDDGSIRSASCYDGCNEEYQNLVEKSLELDDLSYDDDYEINEYHEEGDDGSTYDVFEVVGK